MAKRYRKSVKPKAERSPDPFAEIDALADKLPRPEKGHRIYGQKVFRELGYEGDWVTGLGLRRFASRHGRDGWVIDFLSPVTHTERQKRICDLTPGHTKEVFRLAAELRLQIAAGRDPLQEEETKRAELVAAKNAPTIAELIERFKREHVAKLAPSTRNSYYELVLNKYISPELAGLKVADVALKHGQGLIDKVAEGYNGQPPAPYQAFHVATVLQVLMKKSAEWGLRPDCPFLSPITGKTRLVFERSRERQTILTEQEMARCLEVLVKYANQPRSREYERIWVNGKRQWHRADRPGSGNDGRRPAQSARACLLALLTGARMTEVLSSTWDQWRSRRGTPFLEMDLSALDDEEIVWTIPTKYKNKLGGEVPVGKQAIANIVLLLRADREADAVAAAGPAFQNKQLKRYAESPYLFPQWKPNGQLPHQRSASDFLNDVLKPEAQLPDSFVFHDTRHNFASWLASNNVSLLIISKLLRHKRIQTTMRYATPNHASRRLAVDTHGLAVPARPIACARPTGLLLPDED